MNKAQKVLKDELNALAQAERRHADYWGIYHVLVRSGFDATPEENAALDAVRVALNRYVTFRQERVEALMRGCAVTCRAMTCRGACHAEPASAEMPF